MIAINLTGDDFKRHATAMDIVPVKKKRIYLSEATPILYSKRKDQTINDVH